MADTRVEQRKKPTAQPQSNRPARTPSALSPQSAPVDTQRLLQRAFDAPASLSTADGAHLQRTIGNWAVGQLLQAKLKVGPAGDKYEQEADRTASQVMRSLSAPGVQRNKTIGAVQPQPSPVQREEMDEETLQTKPLADGISRIQRAELDDEEELQAKPLHGLEGGEVDPGVAATISSAKGGGQPLHDGVRASMERGFGADFGGVRVHTGGQADALNRSLNAKAFTTGKDIFFGKGEYNPGSSAGQKLIAHELTHTVQQGAVSGKANRIQTKVVNTRANDRFLVQRGFFDKLKVSSLKKKYQSLKERIVGPKEEKKNEPEESGSVLKASIALKIGTEVRSEGNRKENGHAWIELEPLQPWPEIEKSGLPAKMSEATRQGLTEHQWHTIGFYPGGKKRSSVFSIPGKIQEPEKPSMTQDTTASKSFELNKTQAEKLLDYVKEKRDAKYNFMRYNCTSFAVGALGAAGFTANEFLGRVTSKRVSSPNKVYKRLFERAVLGDKSVKIAKTLGQKEKHISDPEESALKSVSGGEGDLLKDTEDVKYTSENAKSFSFTLRRMLKDKPGLKTEDLTGWHWMMQEFSAHDKRTLEAAYPTVFDRKIDDVLKPKTQDTPPMEEQKKQDDFGVNEELTNFFDEPEEEKKENFGGGDEYTNFFDDE